MLRAVRIKEIEIEVDCKWWSNWKCQGGPRWQDIERWEWACKTRSSLECWGELEQQDIARRDQVENAEETARYSKVRSSWDWGELERADIARWECKLGAETAKYGDVGRNYGVIWLRMLLKERLCLPKHCTFNAKQDFMLKGGWDICHLPDCHVTSSCIMQWLLPSAPSLWFLASGTPTETEQSSHHPDIWFC